MDIGSNGWETNNRLIAPKEFEIGVALESSSSDTKRPSPSKGRGLKKWRRVVREVGKSPNSKLDSTGETRQRSNGCINVVDKVPDLSRLPAFDSNVIRNPSVNNVGITVEHVGEQGKGRKKAREVEIEKENSDSQNSNFLFMQSSSSVTKSGSYENEGHKKFSKNEAGSEEDEEEEEEIQQDIAAVSMMKLHSVQEALEREVQKLKDVGKEDPLFLDEESDFNNEVEEILKQKVEGEVQYIAISKAVLDQMEVMAEEQVETMKVVEGAENKAVELKRQAERLEKTCQEILEKEEALKVESRICRLSSCVSIQLIVFVLVVYMFVLRFSSRNMEILLVPT